MSKLIKANKNLNLKTINLDNPEALKKIQFLSEDKVNELRELKGYQRLLRLTDCEATSLALLKQNIHSVFTITNMARSTFVKEYAKFCKEKSKDSKQKAGDIYDKAIAKKNQVVNTYLAIAQHKSPFYTTTRFDNLSQATDENFNHVPSYQDLFGEVDFCSCPHCRTIFSPAAYFVDLMSMQSKYILQPNEELKLTARRPDLETLELSCKNTNELVPTISIVNEVLINSINDESKGYKILNEVVYPFNLPFNKPLSDINTFLKSENSSLFKIWEGLNCKAFFEINHNNVYFDILGITKKQWDIFITDLSKNCKELCKYFGYESSEYCFSGETKEYKYYDEETESCLEKDEETPYTGATVCLVKKLSSIDTFLQRTQLTYPELNELLFENLSCTQIANGEIQEHFFINQGTEQDATNILTTTIQKAFCDDKSIDKEELVNLNETHLSNINRFVRLAKAIGFSFIELDWVLRTIGFIITGEDKAILDDSSLPYLAWFKQIKENNPKLSMEEICAIQGLIKDYGDTKSQSLFDKVYNNTNVPNPPSWPSADLKWKVPSLDDTTITQDEQNQQIEAALSAALKISETELILVAQKMISVQTIEKNELPLTLENLSTLYRFSLLPQILKLSVEEIFTALEFSGQEGALDNIVKCNTDLQGLLIWLQEFSAWSQKLSLSTYEIEYLLTGQSQNPKIQNQVIDEEKFKNFSNELDEEMQTTLITKASLQTALGVYGDYNQYAEVAQSFIFDNLTKDDLKEKVNSIFPKVDYDNKTDRQDYLLKSVNDNKSEMDEDDFIKKTKKAFAQAMSSDYFMDVLTKKLENKEIILDGIINTTQLEDDFFKELLFCENLSEDSTQKPSEIFILLNKKLNELMPVFLKSNYEVQQNVYKNAIANFFNMKQDTFDVLSKNVIDIKKAKKLTLKNLQTIQRYGVLINTFNLSQLDVQSIMSHPNAYDYDKKEISIVFINSVYNYKSLQIKFEDTQNLFSSLINENISDKKNLIDPLYAITQWNKQELSFLITKLGFKLPLCIDDIHQLNNWFTLSEQSDLDVKTLYKLYELDSEDIEYSKLEKLSSLVWSGLVTSYESKPDELKNIKSTTAVLTRNHLAPYVLACFQDKNDLHINNLRDLSNYLLIDIEVGAEVETSVIKSAISTVQMYVYRCLNNLEQDIDVLDNFESWWEWMANYRLWEANRKVFIFPENYLEPELRTDKTPLFTQLETNLQQADLKNLANVEMAMNSYLDEFSKIANLSIDGCAGYDYSTYINNTGKVEENHDVRVNESFKNFCFIGKTKEEPYTYYYRMAKFVQQKRDETKNQYLPVDWQPWSELNISFQPLGAVKPYFAFGKWFIFWVEQLQTSAEKEKDFDVPQYTMYIKSSYLNLNNEWSVPKTLESFKDNTYHKYYESQDAEKNCTKKVQDLENEKEKKEKDLSKEKDETKKKILSEEINQLEYEICVFKNISIFSFEVMISFVNSTHSLKISYGLSEKVFLHLGENYLTHNVIFSSKYISEQLPNTIYENGQFTQSYQYWTIFENFKEAENKKIESLYSRLTKTKTFSSWLYPQKGQNQELVQISEDTKLTIKEGNLYINDEVDTNINFNVSEWTHLTVRAEEGLEGYPEILVEDKELMSKVNSYGFFNTNKTSIISYVDNDMSDMCYMGNIGDMYVKNELESFTLPEYSQSGITLFKYENKYYLCWLKNFGKDRSNSLEENNYYICFGKVDSRKKKIVRILSTIAITTYSYTEIKNDIILNSLITPSFVDYNEKSYICHLTKDGEISFYAFIIDSRDDLISNGKYNDINIDNKDILCSPKLFVNESNNKFYMIIQRAKEKTKTGIYRIQIELFELTFNGDDVIVKPHNHIEVKNNLPSHIMSYIEERGNIYFYMFGHLYAIDDDMLMLQSSYGYDSSQALVYSNKMITSLFFNQKSQEDDSCYLSFKFIDNFTIFINGEEKYTETFFKTNLFALNAQLQSMSTQESCFFSTALDEEWIKELYNNSRNYVTKGYIKAVNSEKQYFEDSLSALAIGGQPGWQRYESQGIGLFCSIDDVFQMRCYRLNTTAVEALCEDLYLEGMDKLLSLDAQHTKEIPFEILQPNINNIPMGTWPSDTIDFKNSAMSMYYWEIFFYMPYLIAKSLQTAQQNSMAKTWYEYIFNPTVNLAHANTVYINDKYWRFLALRSSYNSILEEELDNPWSHEIEKATQADSVQLYAYHNNPFEPHILAKARPISYQKNIVMHYIDNLITWGDKLFKEYTVESIVEAMINYMTAYDLLGESPKYLGECPLRKEMNLKNFIENYDGLKNLPEFLIELERKTSLDTVAFKSNGIPVTYIPNIYFNLPENEQLMQYWDVVKDRIYNIRHGLNIEGVRQKLALFEPAINPAQLVAQIGSGGSLSSSKSMLNSAIPYYRFVVVLQLAKNTAGSVIQFGQSLLSALEKKDAEKLNLLQNQHQLVLLEQTTATKQAQVEFIEQTIESLQYSLKGAEDRDDYYTKLIDKGLSELEESQTGLSSAAGVASAVGAGFRAAAIPVYSTVPTVYGFAVGGMNPGRGVELGAVIADATANGLNQSASIVGMFAAYERRAQEWELQKELAQNDTTQIKHQIDSTKYQLQGAKEELKAQEKSIKQMEEVQQILKSKFTNEQLYQWMVSKLSSLFFQTYQLALDISMQAQQAWNFEKGVERSFIKGNYWDGLYDGLLSGESLMLSLNQMENAYMQENKRSLEIQKSISLNTLMPEVITELKEQGECIFDFNEKLFDDDYPGMYNRQIKSITVTIPAVVGPYENIKATLTQLRNATVLQPDIEAVQYLIKGGGSNKNIREDIQVNQQIAISTGVNDSGMFSLNFNDERYLPFEGTGVVSTWMLVINNDKTILDNISDVIVQVNYTALQGSLAFEKEVKELNVHKKI